MKLTIRFSFLGVVLLFGFAPRTYTIELVRENIISSFLGPASSYRKYDSNVPIDTDPDLPGLFKLGSSNRQYPQDHCDSSPAYLYYALYISIDSNAYWNYDACAYTKTVTDRFKSLFGEDIIKTRIKMAQKDYEGKAMEWRHYKAEGLQAAFDKLYQKPNTPFRGYLLQQVYNGSAKEYARSITDVVVKVMARKTEFEGYAKTYMKEAVSKSKFEGQAFSNRVTPQLIGATDNPCLPTEYASRIVGIMLRRQCDGSLPTLLNCLKTVLKDYDPEYYSQVGSKF